MKAVTNKPLVSMNENELKASVDAAVRCANLLIQKCSEGGGLTVRDLPSPSEEFPLLDPDKPEWIRMPKGHERCKYTGLSRSFLYTLVSPCEANDYRPPVRSVSLRRRGMQRGVRLISYESLMAFLKNQPTTGDGDDEE